VTDYSGAGFGSGPFRVESFRPNETLTLVRNPYYPGPGPKVERTVYKIIQPPVARLAEFRRGLIDIMGVPDDYYDQLSADPGTAKLISRAESLNVYFLGFNCTRAPFDDVTVRRAFAQALDVRTVCEALLGDRAVPASGPIPPGIPGRSAAVRGIGYDLNSARSVLAAAGLVKGRAVRFLCGADKDTINICRTILGELSKAGLDVQLIPRETGTFKQMLKNGDFDVYYYSWWADYPDAENFLAPLFLTSSDRGGGNPTGYSNPEVDKLIGRLQREPDPQKRAQLCGIIEQMVVSDASRVWLWHRQELTIRQPWVENYILYPIYNADKGSLVGIKPPEGPQTR
jgi:peptide/nickel transport system substrate-binding protein/oligopeptide transport system substrate-binding protein